MSEGFMWCIGLCFGCGQVFAYDPDRVPSIRVNADRQPDPAGEREPVCRPCMDKANAKRATMGLPPHPIMEGAYVE